MVFLKIAFRWGVGICDADFHKATGYKGAGLFFGLLFFLPGQEAIVGGWMADLFFEKGAEGAEAFETYLVAYLDDGAVFADQRAPGLFEPFAGQVLMRRYPVDTRK